MFRHRLIRTGTMPMIGECMNFCSRCGDEGHPDHECPSYPAARAPHVDAARCSIQQRDVPEEILPAPNVLIRSVCLCVCRSLSLPLSPLVFSLCFSVSAPAGRRMPADNSCMFHCIADSSNGVFSDAASCRARIVATAECWDGHQQRTFDVGATTYNGVNDLIAAVCPSASSFMEWCDDMRQSAAWGDVAVLGIASVMVNAMFKVYERRVGGHALVASVGAQTAKFLVRLEYAGRSHYNCLLLRPRPRPHPAPGAPKPTPPAPKQRPPAPKPAPKPTPPAPKQRPPAP